VREWLERFGLLAQTTHEQRVEIDREIERRTGVSCDRAIEQQLISPEEFRQIVETILKRKQKRKEEIPCVV